MLATAMRKSSSRIGLLQCEVREEAAARRRADPALRPRLAVRLDPLHGAAGRGRRRALDSYDNALAETINGLYKTELIRRRAPWKTREAVELATLEWVSWLSPLTDPRTIRPPPPRRRPGVSVRRRHL